MVPPQVKREPRIVLLTGDGLRHRYVASRLAASVKLVGIVTESKAPVVSTDNELSAEDEEVIHRHFAERDAAEERLFGSMVSFPGVELRTIPHGAVNTPDVASWVQARSPDFVVLYGSGIIKQSLLNLYFDRVINMHLGLSPYYRGSGTNFWPLVNGEPECLGVTIHLAVQSVDAGPILAQVRPVVEVADRTHDLGSKAIMAGAETLAHALHSYAASRLLPRTQDLSFGRVYRNRDFNAEAVRLAWRNLSNGMLSDYINNREARCCKFPIKDLA